MKTVSDALVHIIETQTKVHRNYSGRGMCGETCFGFTIIGDSWCHTHLKIYAAISDDSNSKELAQEFLDLLDYARSDSLGTRRICYFPGYQTVETDKEAEEND